MRQEKIMELLREAASTECWQRANEIQCELVRFAYADDGAINAIGGREAGIKIVLETLFVSTWQNRKDLLPNLFPAFAVICGDRQLGNTVVNPDINWKLVS